MTFRSLQARRVLIDSSAYLAVLDGTDSFHDEALALTARLLQARYRHYLTNSLLFEAHALIMRSLGIYAGQRFLRDVTGSTAVIIRVRQADERRAIEIIERYQDKDFSFTDALSFVVMERLRIPLAFTFDQHFAQYGLNVLTEDTPL